MRAAFLPAFIGAAKLLEVDADTLVRQVGIDPGVVEQPDTRIPTMVLQHLLRLGAEVTGRRDFPLVVAHAFRPQMLGATATWAVRQGTIGQGLEFYLDRFNSRNNSVAVAMERADAGVVFRLAILDPELRDDSMHVALAMGIGLRMLRLLLGEGWWPETTWFASSRPDDISAHRRMFGKVEFEREIGGFVIDPRCLDQPIREANPSLVRLIERYAAANAKSGGARATDVLCEMIARLLPTGHCSIDHAAAQLGVDRRTIHRRLATEGCCFTELVDRIRRELMVEEIGDSDRSLTAIAGALGFSSLSTFSRWHRHAFGAAARDLRRRRDGLHPANTRNA